MRISKIDNITPSFKRIIKISNVHVPYNEKTRFVTRDNLNEIDRVLNNKTSFVYTEEEQDKIRKFFTDITGDYSNKALTRKIPNIGTVLITGKDCEKISRLERKQRVQHNLNSSAQDVSNYRVEKAILDKMENGHEGKKKSIIKLYTSTTDEELYNPCERKAVKADEIEYMSSVKRFFPQIDGHICRDKMMSAEEINSKTPKGIDLVYDYSSITFD